MVMSTIIWFALMFLTYRLADDYRRDILIWMVVGFILSPLVSVIGLLIMGRNRDRF